MAGKFEGVPIPIVKIVFFYGFFRQNKIIVKQLLLSKENFHVFGVQIRHNAPLKYATAAKTA